MKTLVIVNSSEEELSDFKEKFADELKRDDVIFIENPKDKTDLEKRLESHRGEFDRVVIIAHGNKDEIPIINVFGKDNVAITDVIKTVNKGNEETLKKIHLTSCHIGSNFNRIEQKDSSSDYYLKLDESLQDGQILFLHGDSYASDSELSLDKRLKGIVESQNYSISEAVLDSTEGISVAVKKHRNPIENSSLETFSYQSFGRKYEEFSTAYLKPYLNEMVTKARNFEKACGILNGDVSEQRLKNLSEENYQQYLSDNFIMEVTKFNDNKLIVRAASLFRRATDINLANRYGLTALMIAVATGQTEVAKLLLENKTIDPNLADKNGFTALLLLKNKTINPNLADKNGFTALMFAADKGQTKAAKLLLEDERVKPNLANKDGWTALMIAIEKGQTKVAKLLLEDKRVNLNLADKDGWTALMIAIEKGQTEVAKLLLENKTINPNLADKNGFTALMLAADKGNVEIVEYLIKKGADPEIKNSRDWTALMIASEKGQTEVAKLLLEYERVNPNLADKNGFTALMIAIENGQTEVAKLLLEDERVNPNPTNKDDLTALMIAVATGQTEVAKLLLENKTINPNLADKNGFTALMFAADKSNVEIVEYLIKKGADPEIKDPNGSAPSYFAGGKNKDKIIELLSQAIKKKQQDSILKEWKSAFSAKEIEEMQCNPSNFFSDSSGQKINQCAFEELQQKYLANLGSKESGQDFSTKNLILREDKSLSSKIEELREHNSPSSTITDGSKLLFGVTAGVAAKLVAKKFTTEEKQKKNLGTVR